MEQYTAFPTHDLVWVTGDDAVGFLDGLLSQGITSMEPGSVARSFLLAPNGKVRALLWVLRDDDGAGLVADVGLGDRVVGDLTRFKLRVAAGFSDVTPLYARVGARRSPGPSWRYHGDGVEVEAGPVGMTSLVPEGAAQLVDYSGMRITTGLPVMGVDIDDSTIPQETGLVAAAVDFTKGCYLGQELVARIDTRGHVNRRLARVDIAGELDGPAAGAVVSGPAGPAGTLTTVARGVGMGLIRREVGDGDTVEVTWNGEQASGLLSTDFAVA